MKHKCKWCGGSMFRSEGKWWCESWLVMTGGCPWWEPTRKEAGKTPRADGGVGSPEFMRNAGLNGTLAIAASLVPAPEDKPA